MFDLLANDFHDEVLHTVTDMHLSMFHINPVLALRSSSSMCARISRDRLIPTSIVL